MEDKSHKPNSDVDATLDAQEDGEADLVGDAAEHTEALR